MKSHLLVKAIGMFLILAVSADGLAWQAHRRYSGRRQVDIKLISQQVSTTNATTYNFTVNLPAPSPGRKLIIAAYGFKNASWASLLSMNVAGNATTAVVALTVPLYLRLYDNDTLSGDQTFSVTYDQTLDRSGIAVYEVYGWSGLSDTATDTARQTNKTWTFTSVPKGSKIMIAGYNPDPNAFTWTNGTESVDVTLEASDQASIGIRDVVEGGNQSLTFATTSGAYSIALVMRSR